MDLENLSEEKLRRLVQLYSAAEKDILRLLNQALLKDDPAYLGKVRKRVHEIMAKVTNKGVRWTEVDLAEVYQAAVGHADVMIEKTFAGIEAVAVAGKIHEEAVKVLAANTEMRLQDIAQIIGRRVEDIYRNAALEAVRGSIIGYQSWREVSRKYKSQLADEGITGFKDKLGRRWNMTTYVEMVARTTTAEAHLQGTANRILELGHDLVKVSTHKNACHKCEPWQGRIISLTGATEGYPTLEDAKAAGLFHPNCRHAYGLFVVDSDTSVAMP